MRVLLRSRQVQRCLYLAVILTLAAGAGAEQLYIVELHGLAAVEAAAQSAKQGGNSGAAAKAQVAANRAEQQGLLGRLSAKRRAPAVAYQTQRVFNGIALFADADLRAALAADPAVRAVHRARRFAVQVESSVPWLGVDEVWEALGGGLTGEGVSIGVIDTGLDYLHPTFGGEPFPNAHVVGGFDFVGDAYDLDDPATSVPRPDADPMDQNGHGTHVAGIVAGRGVAGDGATFAGPYDRSVPFEGLALAPGVAPRAAIHALKIFGAGGETEVLIPALEYAVDPNADGDFSDRLDVINMSLGAPYGRNDLPEVVASENAAAAGVIVVASAGNSGDIYFAHGLPGSAPSAISVAAVADEDPDAGIPERPDALALFTSRGPAYGPGGVILKPDLAAPGVRILSADMRNFAALRSGTSMAAPHIAGVMALLRQWRPDWRAAELKALLLNSALTNVQVSAGGRVDAAGPTRAGAGRTQPLSALDSDVIVFHRDQPARASVSFPLLQPAATTTFRETVRVWNRGAELVEDYAVRVEVARNVPGVTVALAGPESGTLAPGEFVDVELDITVDPARCGQPRPSDVSPVRDGAPRHYLTRVAGDIVVTLAEGAVQRRLPYFAIARPSSTLRTPGPMDATTPARPALELAGRGLSIAGNPPEGVRALAYPFALLHRSPRITTPGALGAMADLRYVGATIAPAPTLEAEPTLYIGLATYAPWHTPSGVQFEVLFDTDRDGEPDVTLHNDSADGPFAGDDFGVRAFFENGMGTVRERVGPLNGYTPEQENTFALLNDVAVLPVPVSRLMAGEGPVPFFVRASTTAGDTFTTIDETPLLTFDVNAPPLDFVPAAPAGPAQWAGGGSVVSVFWDEARYLNSAAEGVLLFFPHNAEARAQWQPIVTTGDQDGDGIADAVEGADDRDGDGTPNLLDEDSDGDTLLDVEETDADTDGDGAPNALDLDSDDDGLSDQFEAENGLDPRSRDTDQDGREDGDERDAGTDPAVPQAPPAVTGFTASNASNERGVQLRWDLWPGATQYRVWRAASPDFDAASVVAESLVVANFLDTDAPAPEVVPAQGCQGEPTTRPITVYYWVQARNGGGAGPNAGPVAGARGGDAGVAAAGMALVALLLLGAGLRHRRFRS